MAYAFIVGTHANGLGGSTTTTSGIDTTGADLIVVTATGTTGITLTLSDSKSNTWTAASYNPLDSGATATFTWYCQGGTVGTAHTFSTTGGSNHSIAVMAFSGSTASPFDQVSSAFANQPGSLTPSQANCLVATIFGGYYTISTLSVDAPFNNGNEQKEIGGGSVWTAGMAYEIQTTATARNPTWTADITTGQATAVLSFKAGAGGGGGGGSRRPSQRTRLGIG